MKTTIEPIVKRYPSLHWVFELVSEHVRSDWCEKCRVYTALKNIASGYVGWSSPDEEFSTSESFDLVMGEIINRMGM